MARLVRFLRLPASESQMGFVLALCAVAMSIMAIGLVWQAQIIARQDEAIRFLESLKFGS